MPWCRPTLLRPRHSAIAAAMLHIRDTTAGLGGGQGLCSASSGAHAARAAIHRTVNAAINRSNSAAIDRSARASKESKAGHDEHVLQPLWQALSGSRQQRQHGQPGRGAVDDQQRACACTGYAARRCRGQRPAGEYWCNRYSWEQPGHKR
jgi:hypothetical protein